MMRPFRPIVLLFVLTASSLNVAARAATVDFEDISVPTDPSISPATGGEITNAAGGYTSGGNQISPSYTSAPDGYGDGGTFYSSSFTDGGVQFANSAIPQDFYYAGWAISNVAGVTFPTQSDYNGGGQADYLNQYQFSTFNGTQQAEGGGFGGSSNYAVVYDDGVPADSMLTLPAGTSPVSMELNATTYMALDVLYGDNIFPSGFVPGDSLTLNINGFKADGSPVSANPVQQVMADYPVGASSPSVLDQWTNVNLTPLAGAATLTFSFTAGSDTQLDGQGIVNPTYFAADNLILAPTPEPSSLVLALIAGLCVAVAAARKKMRRAFG